MKRILLSILFFLSFVSLSFAQTPTTTTGINSTGATSAKILSTASTNANLISAGLHTLYDLNIVNTNATTAYLKLYDKAITPTCNTDTVKATIPLVQNIPVNSTSFVGKVFSLGLGLCITGGIADNDNTNATTGIAVNLSYK